MLQIEQLDVDLDSRTILRGVSLVAPDRAVTALLGPSGSGKTTLLRSVAGLVPSRGTIRVDGRDVAGLPTHLRGVGLMFQDLSLFPHLDVSGNVEFGLRMHRWEPQARQGRVKEILELVGLGGMETRKIHSLSGGEQQRVALARALAPRPRLLMLDEPLGALDRALRERLIRELAWLFEDLRITVLLVTHDQAEAFDLGDHVVVLSEGKVGQTGTPLEVWTRPADERIARLLGHVNIVEGIRTGDRIQLPWGPARATAPGPDGPKRVLIRSNGISIGDGGVGSLVPARVIRPAFRGDHIVITVQTPTGIQLEILARAGTRLSRGDRVDVRIDPSAVVVLGEGSTQDRELQ
jgi:thiamine transport system ATP-binding protein